LRYHFKTGCADWWARAGKNGDRYTSRSTKPGGCLTVLLGSSDSLPSPFIAALALSLDRSAQMLKNLSRSAR